MRHGFHEYDVLLRVSKVFVFVGSSRPPLRPSTCRSVLLSSMQRDITYRWIVFTFSTVVNIPIACIVTTFASPAVMQCLQQETSNSALTPSVCANAHFVISA